MRLRTNHTSSESRTLTEKIVNKLQGATKPSKEFFISTIILFLSLRGRYNFKGMGRYSPNCEMTFHNQFEKEFDFLSFDVEVCKDQFKGRTILAFGPSYIPKSGKCTPNVDHYYSGCLGRPAKGLEIGGLAAVSIDDDTAFHLRATQAISRQKLNEKGMTLAGFYAQAIIGAAPQVSPVSRHLAVDGHFAELGLIGPAKVQTGLDIICKLRKDANLKYLYKGPKRKGPGRPKKYAGKINVNKIDRRRFDLAHQDEDVKIYQTVCWPVRLKRKTSPAYVQPLKEGRPTGSYAMYFSTDLELDGLSIYCFYKARFQVEFLFRDAKQHTGLANCQSRNEKKLHYHFNMPLSSVNVAKAAHYLTVKKEDRAGFSLADVKTCHFNELMLNFFLSNLDIRPELIKK